MSSPGIQETREPPSQTGASFLARASRAFWRFAEGADIFSRALFLWSLVFGADLLIYLVLTQIIIPSHLAGDNYLSSLKLSFMQDTVAFYLIAALLAYAALFILKNFRGRLSENVIGAGILLACVNFIHVCHFFGGIFILIAPIFLIITTTNVSVFLGPRLGQFTLYLSVALYFGSVAAQGFGYLDFMSVIRLPVTVDQIFTNIILASTFTIILGLAMLLFESLVISIVTVINQKTGQAQALNAQLAASNARLERLDSLKDDFLGMVSHDLRSPLTGILAYAYMVRDEWENLDPANRRRYLDIVIDESNRLNRLVDDLLDVQRFEAGRMILEFSPLDLVLLVREAVAAFKGAAGQRGTEIREGLPPGPLMVQGNRDRLLQVLSNLFSNALKFTPPNGLIEIGMEAGNGPDGPRVTVSVKDNGPGIQPQFQSRLFEKFQRGQESVQGTGLGLALVKQIVEAHHGLAGARSEPGKGSVFFFTLPLIPPL